MGSEANSKDVTPRIVSAMNPAAPDSFAGTLSEILKSEELRRETCIQAIVTSITDTDENGNEYNTLKYGRVKVRPIPMIANATTVGVSYSERKEFWTSYRQHACGGFCIYVPLRVGDTGWVIASDRDSYLGKTNNSAIDPTKNKGSQNLETFQIHKYSHGFFLPDSWITLPDWFDGYLDQLYIGTMDAKEKGAIRIDRDGEIYGISSGGSSLGDGNTQFVYNSSNGYIGGGYIQVGRYFVWCNGYDLWANKGKTYSGYVSLKIKHSLDTASLDSYTFNSPSDCSSNNRNTFEYTEFPLFYFTNGSITQNYKGLINVAVFQ